jgi:hypothetical protein
VYLWKSAFVSEFKFPRAMLQDSDSALTKQIGGQLRLVQELLACFDGCVATTSYAQIVADSESEAEKQTPVSQLGPF